MIRAASVQGSASNAWVDQQDVLDAVYQPLEDLLVAAVPADRRHVLDVGCGTGGTTVAVARRLGAARRCVGVDISESMIAAARTRAERTGAAARFVRADAQDHAFPPGTFDGIVSRFGVMFFDDPVRAFANLRRAATGDAELRFVAWRSADENPFMTTAARAAAPLLPNLPVRPPDGPGQWAFADPDRVRRILDESGWGELDFRAIDPICAMPESALVGYFTGLGPVGIALAGADAQTHERVVAAVRPAFDAFVDGAEVRFTAACWMVGARARS